VTEREKQLARAREYDRLSREAGTTSSAVEFVEWYWLSVEQPNAADHIQEPPRTRRTERLHERLRAEGIEPRRRGRPPKIAH
jgi:hypothetical protein